MPSSMVALPESVLIDVDAGGTYGPTQVHYVTDFHGLDAFLWERTVGDPWTLIEPPSISTPTGDPNEEGVISKELQLGQVYQVLLFYHDHADPNLGITDPPPDAQATAFALRKGPESEDLLVREEFSAFGTGFGGAIETVRPTFAVLQVSKDGPVTDAEGILSFMAPIGTVTSDFNERHSLEVASAQLLPGNAFHALLRMTDKSGNWQFHHKPFVTLRRRVRINLNELRVINDGAQGNNTASFRIWVMQGKKLVSQCELPEREISDSPDPGFEFQELIPLASECTTPVVLGPGGDNRTE